MLDVLIFGVMGLTHTLVPQRPIGLRVVMAVKDDRPVADILAASEDEWEGKAKAAGFTIVPMEEFKLVVEKRLWEPVNLSKAIETLKLLRQVSFVDVRSLADLPTPVQKALLERGNRFVRPVNGGALFDLNTACTIGSGPEYTMDIDGRTFTTSLQVTPKLGGAAPSGPNDRQWVVDERTLARTEDKKAALTMRLSRPVSEVRYFRIVQSSNEALAKRWADLRKTYDDLELSLIGSQYGTEGGTNPQAPVPDTAMLSLTLDAQAAGLSRQDVATRGRVRQRAGGIVISLKIPGPDNSYFGMGIRDLFELP